MTQAEKAQKNGGSPFFIHRFDTLPSTNEYAKTVAVRGMPEGTVIVADSQTAGYGRLGRTFVSPTGCGLYASLILRPAFAPTLLPLITVAAAVAVAVAAEEIGGCALGIKWVNDIYSERGKVSGILTESAFSATGGVAYAVLGFGVNLFPWPETPAEAGPAATLFSHTPAETERREAADRLLRAILHRFLAYYTVLPQKTFMAEYRRRSVLIGKEVTVFDARDRDKTDPLYTARVLDVDGDGALRLRTAAGEEKRLTFGEVSLAVQ